MALTFSHTTPGTYDPETGEWVTPVTETVTGNGKRVKGDPEVYRSRMCGVASVLQPARPECLGQLYPDPRRLLEKDVPLLRRLGLSVFGERPRKTDDR